MAYTRANALTYATGEYASLLSDAGIAASDTQAGLKSALDATFRALGVLQASLVTASVDDTLAGDAEALMDYYTLRRLFRETARYVQISKGTAGTQVAKYRQQMHAQVGEAMKDAKALIEGLGYSVAVATAEVYSFNLDYLEPQETGAG